MYYINSGIVTFLTHILCDSYWIMVDGRIEYIFWLLMNFPDNLLITCTSYEQVNLPSSHNGNIYYFNTGIVTILTHILRDSYWIMGDGRIENIYWLLMNFPDNLLTTCTFIDNNNRPSSHIGEIYYINCWIVTFLTHISCVSYWIMCDARIAYIYTYINFLWTFLITFSWVALLLRRSTYLPVTIEKYIISTPG
jgi:hypothetical protein